jgi:hypothetical protein
MPPVHGKNSVDHNAIFGSSVKECVMIKKALVASGSVLLVGLLLASVLSQEESARSGVASGSQTQPAREVTKDDEKKNALEILDVKFGPIHQGNNVVRVRVKNVSKQARVFPPHPVGLHARTGGKLVGMAHSDDLVCLQVFPRIRGPATRRISHYQIYIASFLRRNAHVAWRHQRHTPSFAVKYNERVHRIPTI